MSSEYVFKDVTAIHARLFHHTPALQGHINFFVKEFEEKRGERESLRLNSTYKNMSYIKDQGLTNSLATLGDNISSLKDAVNRVTELCQNILASATADQSENQESFLESERARRRTEWDGFISLQCERSAAVDKDYENQVVELRAHYDDLENKLKGTKVVL